LVGGAMAQNATTTATPAAGTLNSYMATDSDNLATEIIGKQVYSSAATDAEHIGDINNLVVGDAGDIQAVVIGVGGFLGLGEKNVAVSMDDLEFVTAEDNTERYVLNTTKEALNAAPAFEWTDDQPTDTAAATVPADNAMAPADDTATGAVATNDNAMAPAADATRMDPLNRDGTADFDEAQLTADELKGINVYGTNDEHIGTIGDLALNEDGTVDALIIDFGGFLGIGTKPVAVAFEDLDFLADPNNNRSLVLPITREQMEAAPAFNKDTYTAERDTQRLVINKQS
jgi:sporulation protein YlmC with PRC-barrel domain